MIRIALDLNGDRFGEFAVSKRDFPTSLAGKII
jgi:hypothetical protein